MTDEARLWLAYAEENLVVAELAVEHALLNSCLQNAQQALEKLLKAVAIEKNLELRRTHNIRELVQILRVHRITPDLSEDDVDLMDSIYLPSKYPVLSALPDAMPTVEICRNAIGIVRKARVSLLDVLGER